MNVYCEDRWNRCFGWNGGASVNEEKENSAATKWKIIFGSCNMYCRNICIPSTYVQTVPTLQYFRTNKRLVRPTTLVSITGLYYHYWTLSVPVGEIKSTLVKSKWRLSESSYKTVSLSFYRSINCPTVSLSENEMVAIGPKKTNFKAYQVVCQGLWQGSVDQGGSS